MDYKTLLKKPAYPLPDYLYHSKIVASKKENIIQKKISIENRLNKKESPKQNKQDILRQQSLQSRFYTENNSNNTLPKMPIRGLPPIEK